MKHLIWLLAVWTPVAGAQTFSVGAKIGGLFTDPAERADQSRKYVVGPSVEVGFGSRFGVEANALYSRFGVESGAGNVRGHSVEFPVLGKLYFGQQDTAVRPWVSGGFAFRNIWFDDGRRFRVDSTEPAVGAVFGGGVAFKLWVLKLAPEVRYTRWGGFNFPATNPDQVQALLGIRF